MIVSPSAKVLFVHVQKTGGTSVSSLVLDNLGDARRDQSLKGERHCTLPTILTAHPEYSAFFIFGFVRNPWARLLSWHLMVERRAHRSPGRLETHPFWRGAHERYPDFESFVMGGTEEFSRLRRPQIDYLRAGDRTADFIGRTEALGQDLATISDRLGVPRTIEVPRLNSSRPRSYQEHYTPQMRDRVAELFAADLDEFGYKFDS